MSNKVETAFLQELKNRNHQAIKRVIEDNTPPLVRAAFVLGLRLEDAEELVQRTFVSFLEALDRFEGRSTIRTYLFGILYRKALEKWRLSAKELATDPTDELFNRRFNAAGHWINSPKNPIDEAQTNETSQLIADCLDRLVSIQKAVFHLKEIERQDNSEICNILEITDTHLRVLLFRARNNLRECLEKKWQQRP